MARHKDQQDQPIEAIRKPRIGDVVFYHHSTPLPNGGTKRSSRVAHIAGEASKASNWQEKDQAFFLFILPNAPGANWETREAAYSAKPQDGRWSFGQVGDE